MRLKGDNTCSAVAGYLSHAVTVIVTSPIAKAPTWDVSSDNVQKGSRSCGLLASSTKGNFTATSSSRFLLGSSCAGESADSSLAELVLSFCGKGTGWFGKKDPKFPNCRAEGVGRAVLDADWR